MAFHSATPEGEKNTLTDTWITPQWIIDAIGISDLDPCAFLKDGENPIVKTANNFVTEQENGLTKSWAPYESVFVNFPYSDSRSWLEKCSQEGKVTDIIVLCFVRSETQAWQKNVKNCTGINLMNKRVKFLTADGVEKGNGNAPSCLIAWGEKAFERIQKVDGLIFRK